MNLRVYSVLPSSHVALKCISCQLRNLSPFTFDVLTSPRHDDDGGVCQLGTAGTQA